MIIRRLYYNILRKFNKCEPSREEVSWLIINYSPYSKKIGQAIDLYVKGYDYNQISIEMKCTRERARAMIAKGVITAWKHLK